MLHLEVNSSRGGGGREWKSFFGHRAGLLFFCVVCHIPARPVGGLSSVTSTATHSVAGYTNTGETLKRAKRGGVGLYSCWPKKRQEDEKFSSANTACYEGRNAIQILDTSILDTAKHDTSKAAALYRPIRLAKMWMATLGP